MKIGDKVMNIDEVLDSQRNYFKSGVTLDLDFRIEMLKKLYYTIKKYETEINAALKKRSG